MPARARWASSRSSCVSWLSPSARPAAWARCWIAGCRAEFGVVGRALVADQDVRLGRHRLHHGFRDPRLADAGLAGEQDELPLAAPGLPPPLDQECQLLVAPDDRRHPARLPGGEAALEGALADDGESRCRLGDSLEALRPQRPQHEQIPQEPSGRRSHDDLTGIGHALQPCGQIGRVADHRSLLGGPVADQIAHDHEPGRDADAAGERLAAAAQLRHRRHDRETRPHRALGLVLVRPGPAEIGEHAIAHEFRDMAFEPPDLTGHGVLVSAQHVPHFLGVEPGRERCGAREVDEHHGQLAPLGVARRDIGRRRVGGGHVRTPESLKELPARAEREGELLEIGLAQGPEDLTVDLVVAEGRDPTPEPLRHEPCADLVDGLHHGSPGSVAGSSRRVDRRSQKRARLPPEDTLLRLCPVNCNARPARAGLRRGSRPRECGRRPYPPLSSCP